jgi:UDP-N-acetylmuramate: L-alanyl-gamma-D-glutamyl-meso-diaminopimelate ligase
MRVHFVAIAGTGMGALAGLFKAAGHDVSGSDVAFYPPMGPALNAWGIRCLEGFDPAHLEPKPDLVIIGNVCRPANPEAKAARDGGLAVTTMAHALADHMLPGTSPLVVAGTHGKTTTSALAAFLLHAAGRDPGFLIGGLPKDFTESFRLPGAAKRLGLMSEHGAPLRRTPFVIEGDEYDTAFFEKTPKFWHYKPEVAIVTSIEHDHIDIYPDEAAYLAAFRGFVERVPASGLIVAAAADRRVVEIVRAAREARPSFPEVAWFALDGDDTHGMPPHWLAAPVTADASGQTFDLYAGGTYAGRVALAIPGRHNIRNALAALAAVTQGFGVPLATAIEGLSRFSGVRRRQDLLFEAGGVRVYDDFAHHPTAVHETIAAMRAKHAKGALWTVFEPRTQTACRALHQAEYERAFAGSDRVILAPLGRTDIPEGERLDLGKIAGALNAAGTRAEAAASVDAIVASIRAEARPGDTVLLLSNGAFGGIYDKLRAALAERPPLPDGPALPALSEAS